MSTRTKAVKAAASKNTPAVPAKVVGTRELDKRGDRSALVAIDLRSEAGKAAFIKEFGEPAWRPAVEIIDAEKRRIDQEFAHAHRQGTRFRALKEAARGRGEERCAEIVAALAGYSNASYVNFLIALSTRFTPEQLAELAEQRGKNGRKILSVEHFRQWLRVETTDAEVQATLEWVFAHEASVADLHSHLLAERGRRSAGGRPPKVPGGVVERIMGLGSMARKLDRWRGEAFRDWDGFVAQVEAISDDAKADRLRVELTNQIAVVEATVSHLAELKEQLAGLAERLGDGSSAGSPAPVRAVASPRPADDLETDDEEPSAVEDEDEDDGDTIDAAGFEDDPFDDPTPDLAAEDLTLVGAETEEDEVVAPAPRRTTTARDRVRALATAPRARRI